MTYVFIYTEHDGFTRQYSVAARTLQDAVKHFKRYKGDFNPLPPQKPTGQHITMLEIRRLP